MTERIDWLNNEPWLTAAEAAECRRVLGVTLPDDCDSGDVVPLRSSVLAGTPQP